MESAVVRPGLVPFDFHHVNLPAHRPLTIFVLIGGHQPEGGQKALPLGYLQPGLEQAIGKVMLVLRGNASGGVGNLSVLVDCLDWTDQQSAVPQKDVLLRVHILLPFLVDPAWLMQLHIPAAPVQRQAVEAVLKNQAVSFVGEYIVHFIQPPCSD